jgi:hypothetical protein
MRLPIRPLIALLILAAVPAGAQFSQYTAPGTLLSRPTSKKEQMDKALENARWRVGPLRLAPWLSVRDAAYVSDVFAGTLEGGSDHGDEESDFTVTVGAGLQGYVPMGPKVFFTVDVLPQYVYWQKEIERRRLNGYYGVGLLGFFNRLNVQLLARRAEEQGVLSPEFEQRIHTRQDLVETTMELRLGRSFYLFGSASGQAVDPLEEDLGIDPRLPRFEDLHRDETALRAGVEVRPTDHLRLAVGVERTESDFADSARDRSNSGTAPLVEASYDGDHLHVSGTVVQRSLDPEPGSEFVPFDQTTGQFRVTLTPRWRLSYSVYGSRNLTYSIEPGYSQFTIDRAGASIGAKIGNDSNVNLFYETGSHDYDGTSAEAAFRQDDFQAYGTQVQLKLGERLRLNLGVQRTSLESGLTGFDRTLTTFQTSVEISAFGGAFTAR